MKKVQVHLRLCELVLTVPVKFKKKMIEIWFSQKGNEKLAAVFFHQNF